MPAIDDELRKASEHARIALAALTKRRIPLTPENYYVWYVYLTGSNEELTAEIDRIVASGDPFTKRLNRQLYDKYFGKQKEAEATERIHDQTQIILKNILEGVLNTHGHASDYGSKLDEYSHKLEEATKLSQVQHIIENLIEDTAEMARSSQHLEQQLKQATAQTENLHRQLEKTEIEALIDALTGLNNRRALDRKITELCDGFKSNGASFATMMLDIDFFKKFNDKYGHKVGDGVLQAVASVLRGCLNSGDFPARYGGEEFVVLIPKTSLDDACVLADRVRTRMSEKRFRLAKSGRTIGKITISVGVSEMNRLDTAASVLERADKALYLAKDSGRDNVKSEKDL